MTNPNETMQTSRPLDAFCVVARTAAMAGLAAALLVAPLTGCSEEEQAPVAVAPPAPPPPPPPPPPRSNQSSLSRKESKAFSRANIRVAVHDLTLDRTPAFPSIS